MFSATRGISCALFLKVLLLKAQVPMSGFNVSAFGTDDDTPAISATSGIVAGPEQRANPDVSASKSQVRCNFVSDKVMQQQTGICIAGAGKLKSLLLHPVNT